MMSQKEAVLTLDSRRQPGSMWNDAFGERRYRHSRSTSVVPHLGSKSTLVWRREDVSQLSKEGSKAINDQEVIKPKTSRSLPSGTPSLYTWTRTNRESKSRPTQATDRSYRHTYGDCHSTPFDIEIKKDFPKIKQKPDVPNPLTLPSEPLADKPALPNVLVTKIYSKLHEEVPSEDKNCVYVIKNMRRTTPASKRVNLPTVIPLYNIHLVKSVSKVLSQEAFTRPEATNTKAIKRPMSSERKYYSQISGNLLKSRKRLGGRTAENSYESPYNGKAFRSAEVYNKLLALRLANQQLSASEDTKETLCPPLSNQQRHTSPKVTFKSDIEEEIEGPINKEEPVNLNQHVTSVKVSRRSIQVSEVGQRRKE